MLKDFCPDLSSLFFLLLLTYEAFWASASSAQGHFSMWTAGLKHQIKLQPECTKDVTWNATRRQEGCCVSTASLSAEEPPSDFIWFTVPKQETHHLTAEISWTRILPVDETDPSEVCLKSVSQQLQVSECDGGGGGVSARTHELDYSCQREYLLFALSPSLLCGYGLILSEVCCVLPGFACSVL